MRCMLTGWNTDRGPRMKNHEIGAIVKKIVELYCRGKVFYESEFYTAETVLIRDSGLAAEWNRDLLEKKQGKRNPPCRIIHRGYRLILQTAETIAVAGSYSLIGSDLESMQERVYEVSMVLKQAGESIRVALLHISEKLPRKTYTLKDELEHCYRMDEMDVFYLEAGHNRTRWHCRDGKIIETSGNLLHTEKELSDTFLRVHRGFIVNRFHVRKIGRCYVELVTGENISIPVKKYTAVRERLLHDTALADQI